VAYKATVIINNAGVYEVQMVDVIQYEERFWLVPEWLDNHAEKISMPVRIISFDQVAHHRMKGTNPEFVVECPIPKSVFEDRLSSEEAKQYEIVERPPIVIPLSTSTH
jgi:hypothetical protein